MENVKKVEKRSLGWRIARWCVIAVAGLVTLVALIWAEENCRGKRAWDNYKREAEARGEKLFLKDMVPPAVPDEQNFAMTPFLAPTLDMNPLPLKPGQSIWRDTNAHEKLFEFGNDLKYPKSTDSTPSWNQGRWIDLTAWAAGFSGEKDAPPSGENAAMRKTAASAVLRGMEKYAPELAELQTASHRPYCRFNVRYQEDNPAGVLLPHLSLMKRISMMYRLRAAAELAAGRSGAALDDVKMGFYLSKTMRDEPVLISGLVEVAIVNITLQPVWEGLADRRWSDAQLKELQQQLAGIDLLKDYRAVMRGERGFNNAILDYQRRARKIDTFTDRESGSATDSSGQAMNLMPSGWFYQNQVTINRMHDEILLPPVDAAAHRVSLELTLNREANFVKMTTNQSIIYKIFATMMLQSVIKAQQRFTVAAAYVDEATVACALERYRLAHGQFPEKLAALSPQFIEKMPMDVMTGEPLKYRRTEDGQFILYSVGWNGVDDGGKIMFANGTTPSVDPQQGDWVWQYVEAK